jgi:hypothetical protein
LTKNIHLIDVGFVYFIWQFLFLIYSIIENKLKITLILIFIPSTLAFILTLFTLFYQAYFIKKWCKLCILIVSIIWIEQIIIFWYLFKSIENPIFSNLSYLTNETNYSSILICVFYQLLASSWFGIKIQILKASEYRRIKSEITNLKKNSSLFLYLLKQQKNYQCELLENDIILGGKNSSIQLIAVLSPFCKSCAHAYSIIIKLIQAFPQIISVIIRFNVNPEIDDKSTQASIYLLEKYQQTKEEDRINILLNWYNSTYSDNINNEEVTKRKELLQKQYLWIKRSEILYSPFLILNGYNLPSLYNINDLFFQLPYILKDLQSLNEIKRVD